MSVPPPDGGLWTWTRARGLEGRWLAARDAFIPLADLASGTVLGGAWEQLRGKSVVLATGAQLPTVLALLELDGLARRLVLCPPEVTAAQLASVVAHAEADIVVSDRPDADATGLPCLQPGGLRHAKRPGDALRTEWVLLTSGSTGTPKLVRHTLDSLAGPAASGTAAAWGTFYDVRRYGGLTILLRALLLGGSMVLSDPGEPVPAFLARLARHGAGCVSGTPSHWRRALMVPSEARPPLATVRLSGEVADQATLDALRAGFPGAAVSHAFASTEAGFAFVVTDGLEGFPASLTASACPEIDAGRGTIRVRSPWTALGYLGPGGELRDADGWVDTGDVVVRAGGRYVFAGRRGFVINVGGLKVHPEEVEAVLNRCPGVQTSLVRGRPNPVTGAVVAAEVVAQPSVPLPALRESILHACRGALPAHKVPATLRFVPHLAIAPSGKADRTGA